MPDEASTILYESEPYQAPLSTYAMSLAHIPYITPSDRKLRQALH